MGLEIERRFLVEGDSWRQSAGYPVRCMQAYMRFPKGAARVRIADSVAWLTIKGRPLPGSIARSEFEYQIPLKDAEDIIATLCDGGSVEKDRFTFNFKGSKWELDVFHADNEGLVIAEIELDSEDAQFEMPPWLGREISSDHRYSNSSLAMTPFKLWHPKGEG